MKLTLSTLAALVTLSSASVISFLRAPRLLDNAEVLPRQVSFAPGSTTTSFPTMASFTIPSYTFGTGTAPHHSHTSSASRSRSSATSHVGGEPTPSSRIAPRQFPTRTSSSGPVPTSHRTPPASQSHQSTRTRSSAGGSPSSHSHGTAPFTSPFPGTGFPVPSRTETAPSASVTEPSYPSGTETASVTESSAPGTETLLSTSTTESASSFTPTTLATSVLSLGS